MATYQKVQTVEARQYTGPRLTVVSDELGEQVAHDGDYLIGTEARKVTVIAKAAFEAEFKPFTPTPDSERAAADEAKIADLTKQLADVDAAGFKLGSEVNQLQAEVSALQAQISDQTALKAQFTSVSEQLASEQAKSSELQGKLDALTAAEQAKAEAQAKLDAAQAAVDNATKQ
jgi:hypothetical protein